MARYEIVEEEAQIVRGSSADRPGSAQHQRGVPAVFVVLPGKDPGDLIFKKRIIRSYLPASIYSVGDLSLAILVSLMQIGLVENRGRMHWTRKQFFAACAATTLLAPAPAFAHVKWFAAYDVSSQPRPVGEVLSGHFVAVFAGVTVLMFLAVMLDSYLRTKLKPRQGRIETADLLIRAGIGAYAISLFSIGRSVLTPELTTDTEWQCWVQLAVAISMLSARTCVFGAIGLLALYGYGVRLYGVFHLADYPFVIGLAGYLVASSFQRLRPFRMPIAFTGISATLMWGGIEKWAYPQWTYPLLDSHPHLTFGLPAADFMVVAGFVEFALGFYMVVGVTMVRLAAFVLLLIFVSAIADFGKLDAMGHLLIVAVFAAIVLHGPTKLNYALNRGQERSAFLARDLSVGFAVTVCLFFATYYLLQHVEYAPQKTEAVLAVYRQDEAENMELRLVRSQAARPQPKEVVIQLLDEARESVRSKP